jgi:hypothetical protein
LTKKLSAVARVLGKFRKNPRLVTKQARSCNFPKATFSKKKTRFSAKLLHAENMREIGVKSIET